MVLAALSAQAEPERGQVRHTGQSAGQRARPWCTVRHGITRIRRNVRWQAVRTVRVSAATCRLTEVELGASLWVVAPLALAAIKQQVQARGLVRASGVATTRRLGRRAGEQARVGRRGRLRRQWWGALGRRTAVTLGRRRRSAGCVRWVDADVAGPADAAGARHRDRPQAAWRDAHKTVTTRSLAKARCCSRLCTDVYAKCPTGRRRTQQSPPNQALTTR